MKLINKTNNLTIFNQVKIAKGFWQRLVGLMFKKEVREEECLVFFECNWIHTFFMCVPIDVLYLDRKMRVIKILRNIPPFKFLYPVKNSQIVIETSANNKNLDKVKEGDILEFIE